VHLCNAYTLSLAERDDGYRTMLNRGDMNVIDGSPIVVIARRLGLRHLTRDNRPRGNDLVLETFDRGRTVGLRHFLYGSTPETVEAMAGRLRRELPGVDIVGVQSPPFGDLSAAQEAEMLTMFAAAAPDVVWIGLGTPRQDRFVDAYRDRIGATLVAVGAAFDFLAGNKPEAPRWMQRAGLEWLFRLISEPGRLWRRYLVGNAVFLAGAARNRPIVIPT
jgi:N-acetylglucosaminyldiphosphoundecaprenol N-acetyl-beta-D-mannosaminyltransferase